MTAPVHFIPVAWMRLEHYCDLVGEPPDTVRNRCRSGQWLEGHHWKTAGRRMWVHLPRAQEWVESGELRRA